MPLRYLPRPPAPIRPYAIRSFAPAADRGMNRGAANAPAAPLRKRLRSCRIQMLPGGNSIPKQTGLQSVRPLPFLALGAVMRAALRDQGAPDRGSASEAGLTMPPVDPVQKLKPALSTLSVHVVGNGR